MPAASCPSVRIVRHGPALHESRRGGHRRPPTRHPDRGCQRLRHVDVVHDGVPLRSSPYPACTVAHHREGRLGAPCILCTRLVTSNVVLASRHDCLRSVEVHGRTIVPRYGVRKPPTPAYSGWEGRQGHDRRSGWLRRRLSDSRVREHARGSQRAAKIHIGVSPQPCPVVTRARRDCRRLRSPSSTLVRTSTRTPAKRHNA